MTTVAAKRIALRQAGILIRITCRGNDRFCLGKVFDKAEFNGAN